MSQTQIISVVVIIGCTLITAFIFNYLKKKKYNDLVTLLQAENYEEFDKMMESKMVMILFPPFNLDYLRLNSAILRNDEKMILDCFKVFDKHRLNTKQAQEVYMKGFNYFITIENYDLAKYYLDKINELDNEQMKYEVNRIYDIYALKGYKYLDDMLEETDNLDDMYKGVNEFLISLMYENKGDKQKAREYHNLSEKHMKLLDRRISQDMKEKKKAQEKKHK